jgi:hypothetical protein
VPWGRVDRVVEHYQERGRGKEKKIGFLLTVTTLFFTEFLETLPIFDLR